MFCFKEVKALPNSAPHADFAPKLRVLIEKKLAFDDAEVVESNNFDITC